ncbi:3-hydroxyacyl-CoA dehydrogenase NAD-binding domain-containing protein [Limobrevibacterium gyesilva]|uniref:3-hydroxyacyl-CoA dehydrogenase NAD-binding domain-containing protein n=1 Tax=Limobrevibacterium gyesilva TaxID=2991712 RepID=A0AA42CGA5_9PROT|nr:3-hydroxyacyl-CoA dehydrogenase NAD-binding domain-containing protein [Limobrevibacterium gyesilva]MCW3475846.1 3-hydroxyacyl-CoA dehydrogenase NAD-binding domain-containing protein [Limobrevibacterium gyesilva]
MGNINACVDLQRDGDVAVIVMDNPPVNALGFALRDGLMQAFARARDDAGVRLVVLTGTERAFSGGADITEFGKPPREPNLRQVITAIEDLPKPVVAAIQGVALGGGLELALGCHYRVAAPKARLGLPEIKLGLLPGAGGTQRLPRLIGIEKALEIIVTGDPVPAPAALALGMVEAMLDGPFPAAAVAWARQNATAPRRLRERTDKLEPARADAGLIDRVAAPLLKRARAQQAARACAEAVRAAAEKSFDEGAALERQFFMELVKSDESKALRHVFFSEREAQKVPNLPAGVEPRKVLRAAVIGAGTMGGGISMCFANAGIPVTVIETSQEALDRGLGRVEGNYNTSVKRGSITADEAARRRALLEGKLDFAAIADADIVIEAVFEEMELKKQIFRELDRHAKPGAVIASNTSYLDINEMAAVTSRPGDVLGMHFFSPANVMRLLEVVRGAKTSPEALATAVAVGRAIGKVPVVVGVCDGFVGNRMLARRGAQGERLLLEGALPQEVDRALTDFGFRMGPFAMGDLAGLDIGWRLRQARGTRAIVADALVEAGRLGQKTGKGYYAYGADGRTPTPDPEVEKLITDASASLQIQRRAISQQEILERLLFPMINEGARILEEGIAARAGDIDVIWLHGYNWPAYRGGPMFYAGLVGLPYVASRLEAFADASGDASLRPAPLLARLAASGEGFGSVGTARG